MKKLSVLLLISIVLFSGCVGIPTGGEGGDVLINFGADTTEVPAGNPVGLTVSIENHALNPMEDININIIEPEGWNLHSSPISIPDTLQRDGVWEGVWIYTAPTNVLADTPFRFYGRVTFRMKTERGVSVTLVSYDYYKRTNEKSRISTNLPDTGGPIGIEFGTIGKMSYMYRGQDAVIPLRVIITNRGNGKAYLGDEPTSTNLNKVYFSASGDYIDCPEGETYLMKEGSVATVMCTIRIPSDEVTDIKTFSVSVTVTYNYVYDLTSPIITVLSVPGAPTEQQPPEEQPPEETPPPEEQPPEQQPPEEQPPEEQQCVSNEDCCSNVGGGPCEPGEVAYCSDGVCYCGSEVPSGFGEECPPPGPILPS